MVQGYFHFNNIACIRYLAGTVPYGVPGVIFISDYIIHYQIHLHAQGIGEEFKSTPLIIKCIDDYTDKIIVPGRVPIPEKSTDFVRLRIRGDKGQIKVGAVLHHQYLGIHKCRYVLRRISFIVQIDTFSPRPFSFGNPSVNNRLRLNIGYGVTDGVFLRQGIRSPTQKQTCS